MRWPEGPPHLALNPPFVFFGSFLSLRLIEKTVFPSTRTFLLCLSAPFVSP